MQYIIIFTRKQTVVWSLGRTDRLQVVVVVIVIVIINVHIAIACSYNLFNKTIQTSGVYKYVMCIKRTTRSNDFAFRGRYLFKKLLFFFFFNLETRLFCKCSYQLDFTSKLKQVFVVVTKLFSVNKKNYKLS